LKEKEGKDYMIMNFDELKKIVEEEKVKIIVLEEGEPALVIMSFDEYKKSKGQAENSQESLENLPKELIEEPLKIEDLPF